MFCWPLPIFIFCWFINLFIHQDSDILNFDTGSVSWFESNGPGCKPIYPTNSTLENPFRPIRPERVDGCFVEYPIVEVVHSGVQNVLAVSFEMQTISIHNSSSFLFQLWLKSQLLGLIGAICICCSIWDDDDSCEYSIVQLPIFLSIHIQNSQHIFLIVYLKACRSGVWLKFFSVTLKLTVVTPF